MKNISLYALFSLLFLLWCLGVLSQDADKGLKRFGSEVIPEAYDRSSISLILVYESGDRFSSMVKNGFGQITQSDKFFSNPLAQPIWRFNNVREAETNIIPYEVIKNSIIANESAGEIISYWYNRTDEGYMDMERIHERGMINATVEDVMRNQVTTRGNWALMDYGNRLIEKSYIIALDFFELKPVRRDSYSGFSGNVSASLFRINLSEEDKGNIYDSWVVESDSEAEMERKKGLFQEISPEVEYITSVSTLVTTRNYEKDTFLGAIISQRSDEELIMNMAQRVYENIITELEMNYDDFNVITPLYSSRPPAARIGKKEGVSVDQRFFVYEHTYDHESQDLVETRRGVIRAGKNIVDNRGMANVDMEPSHFYQVSGRRLHEGFVIQQRNDAGLQLRPGYSMAEMGRIHGELAYSIGRFLRIPSFYLTGILGFDSGAYPSFQPEAQGNDAFLFGGEELSFLMAGVGLAKGYYPFRNVEFRPHLGVVYEMASNEDVISEEISGIFLTGGASVGLYVRHFMQVVAGYNHYRAFGNALFGDDETEHKYADIFPGREEGAPFFGIRFSF